jgi:hypothetical protein
MTGSWPPPPSDVLGGATYRPPTIEALLSFLEELPAIPPTRFPRLRRALWWCADRVCAEGPSRWWKRPLNALSIVFHEAGWRLPHPREDSER